jgi:hypothetical protein
MIKTKQNVRQTSRPYVAKPGHLQQTQYHSLIASQSPRLQPMTIMLLLFRHLPAPGIVVYIFEAPDCEYFLADFCYNCYYEAQNEVWRGLSEFSVHIYTSSHDTYTTGVAKVRPVRAKPCPVRTTTFRHQGAFRLRDCRCQRSSERGHMMRVIQSSLSDDIQYASQPCL